MAKTRAGLLEGKVALVTGATRGGGRGIAVALGSAGATVYCSGRSVRGHGATAGRPETIDETAELVSAAGGRGVAARCDHTEAEEVTRLVDRIRREAGRLDILVNDIWGGDPLTEWGSRFWELDLAKSKRMFESGLWSHVVTSRLAVPLMIETGGGLVVEIGDGHGDWYRDNLSYDLVKTSVLRLAFAMATELRPHGITALALTPGFMRSEAMLDHFGVTEATWRDAIAKDPHFAQSETPAYLGRAIVALASDPSVADKSGRWLDTGSLAAEYGFTDADGARPCWSRYFEERFAELLAVVPR